MNIKNRLSLTRSEAVEILAKITDSLESKGEFAFDMKGQEVSIEVTDELIAQLSISPNEFSIIFSWEDLKSEEPETVKPVAEVKPSKEEVVEKIPVPGQTQMPRPAAGPQVVAVKAKTTSKVVRRALPDRMLLNTTTLPLDAGFWESAFTSEAASQWTPIAINEELENTKWVAEDEITTLSDLTPTKAQPKKIRSSAVDDDDLFSELEDLRKERSTVKPKPKKATPKSTPPATSTPAAAAPKTSTFSIPTPPPASGAAASSGPPTTPSPSSSGPSAEQQPKPSPSPIPQPGKVSVTTIPQPPGATLGGPPVPEQDLELQKDVENWQDPSEQANEEDNQLMKPSEFISAQDKKKEDESAVNRPPPKAPDSKEDKKKGWASWD